MSKQRWIDAGLSLLAEEGAHAVRIDRVSARVGLSKGSFFHHFANVSGYRAELVAAWEQRVVTAPADRSPEAHLGDLADRLGDLLDVPLERAMRAWALQDADVAASVERVDRARLAALEEVWSRLVDGPRRARAAALLPHLVVIGASVALPPPDGAELDDVFALLAELIPTVRGTQDEGDGS